MIQESNKTFCKVCKELRTRIVDGYYPSSKNKRYIDEEGRLWNGRVAPCCHSKQVSENMKKLRWNKILEEEDAERIRNGII
jgi:hypothetical protein